MFLSISFFSVWVQAYLDTTPSTSYLIISTRMNMKKEWHMWEPGGIQGI